jgi:hypothetical protein
MKKPHTAVYNARLRWYLKSVILLTHSDIVIFIINYGNKKLSAKYQVHTIIHKVGLTSKILQASSNVKVLGDASRGDKLTEFGEGNTVLILLNFRLNSSKSFPYKCLHCVIVFYLLFFS